MQEFDSFASMDWNTLWWEDGVRLLAAVILAALVGWDREAHGHEAGLRTHMMVSLGAAAFGLIACSIFEALDAEFISGNADPVRILGAVVGGVGFLGAGAIMQSGEKVKGLTTAAGLWVVAGIGMACGIGYYSLAIFATLVALMTLTIMKRLVERAEPQEGDD